MTSDTEANLLKFKELMGSLTEEEANRWADIKKTFERNVRLKGIGSDDKFGQVIAQLTTFSDGLDAIEETLNQGMNRLVEQSSDGRGEEEKLSAEQFGQAVNHLGAFNDSLAAIKEALANGVSRISELASQPAGSSAEIPTQKIHVVNRVPKAFMNVIKTQFNLMQSWMVNLTQGGTADVLELKKALDETLDRYQALLEKLEEAARRSE